MSQTLSYNVKPNVRNVLTTYMLRSLLCFVQCSLPLVSGVVLRKDGVGNFKVTMSWAMEGCCVPGMWKLLR